MIGYYFIHSRPFLDLTFQVRRPLPHAYEIFIFWHRFCQCYIIQLVALTRWPKATCKTRDRGGGESCSYQLKPERERPYTVYLHRILFCRIAYFLLLFPTIHVSILSCPPANPFFQFSPIQKSNPSPPFTELSSPLFPDYLKLVIEERPVDVIAFLIDKIEKEPFQSPSSEGETKK